MNQDKNKKNWTRTGKTIQEMSINGGGVITLAEEKSGKDHRLVAIGYTTITKKAKDEN